MTARGRVYMFRFPRAAWQSSTTWVAFCCLLSYVQLFATPWTVAHQAPLSMGFPRQEYWSGLPFPPPGDLLDPGIEPKSPALAGGFFTTEPPGKPLGDLKQQKSILSLFRRLEV